MVVENGGGQNETRSPIGIPNIQLDEVVICRKHIIHLQVFVSSNDLRRRSTSFVLTEKSTRKCHSKYWPWV